MLIWRLDSWSQQSESERKKKLKELKGGIQECKCGAVVQLSGNQEVINPLLSHFLWPQKGNLSCGLVG